MKTKIGIFYSTKAAKTASVAQQIIKAFGDISLEVVEIEKARREDFEAYDQLIFGASTWFDGELPTYWDEALPALVSAHLQGKRIALFGLADQVNYPGNFADAIGLLAHTLADSGATIVGRTPAEGYTYEQSKALVNRQFVGLVLDTDNQPKLTPERITQWVEQLKVEFTADFTHADDTFIC